MLYIFFFKSGEQNATEVTESISVEVNFRIEPVILWKLQ